MKYNVNFSLLKYNYEFNKLSLLINPKDKRKLCIFEIKIHKEIKTDLVYIKTIKSTWFL